MWIVVNYYFLVRQIGGSSELVFPGGRSMKLSLWIALCLALAGCGGSNVNDLDGDGSSDSVDCAPDDPDIHLAATETCSDDIDNDCDGWLDCADADCSALWWQSLRLDSSAGTIS